MHQNKSIYQGKTRDVSDAVLRRCGWLSRQPAPLIEEVLRRGSRKVVSAGQTVFAAGAPAGGLYGVVDGVIALTAIPTGQTPVLVQRSGPGSWVGVMSLFGAKTRTVTVQSVTDAVLFHLPLKAMETLVELEPQYYRAFGELSVESAVLCVQVVEDLMQPDTARRVAATLLRSTWSGEERLALTQLELATMANASRRQVNTILQRFAEQGWIAQGYGSVTVLDADGLRRWLTRETVDPPGLRHVTSTIPASEPSDVHLDGR